MGSAPVAIPGALATSAPPWEGSSPLEVLSVTLVDLRAPEEARRGWRGLGG